MRKVLILGANSAIARAVARCYAAAGQTLYLVGRDPKKLETVVADIKARGHDQVFSRSEDLTDVGRHAAMLDDARAMMGGIDTVLIAGTKTNICCEATARDAMMLDFKVVMVSDCCAALSDDEHRAALENIIQQFGDVMTGKEVLERLRRQSNR